MFIILLVCIGLIVWAFNLSWKRDSVWVRIGNTFFGVWLGFIVGILLTALVMWLFFSASPTETIQAVSYQEVGNGIVAVELKDGKDTSTAIVYTDKKYSRSADSDVRARAKVSTSKPDKAQLTVKYNYIKDNWVSRFITNNSFLEANGKKAMTDYEKVVRGSDLVIILPE